MNKTYEEKRKEAKNVKTIVLAYLCIGIVCCVAMIVATIAVDVATNREYQRYYHLARDCGSPGEVATYLNIYLEKVDGLHGNAGLLYKDARHDLDHQKNVVASYRDRAMTIENCSNRGTIATSLSFTTLTDDMYGNQLELVRWNILNRNVLLRFLCLFVFFVWWWTWILLLVWGCVRYD